MGLPGIIPINTNLTLDGRIVLECALADVCLSCYWPGHFLPHIQVPVFKGMKLKELKEALKSELSQGYVMGNCKASFLLSSDFVGEENDKLADKLYKAAIAAINRIAPAKKGQRTFFNDLEESENEDAETVFAFFVFRDL